MHFLFTVFLMAEIIGGEMIGGDYNVVAGGGPTLFTEDCVTSIDALWTQTGENAAAEDNFWIVASGNCKNDPQSDGKIIEILSDENTNGMDVFCSGLAVVTHSSGRIGCSFHAQGAISQGHPGVHYEFVFDRGSSKWRGFNRNDDHTDSSEINGPVDCTGSWVALDSNDYFGITKKGSGATHTVTMYDFGATPPADLQDPAGGAGWAAAADRVYSCSAGEWDTSGMGDIDTPGRCGLIARSNLASSTKQEAKEFSCGDIP